MKSVYTTAAFWRGLAERALKTFAQTLSALVATGATGLLEVDWAPALSVAGLATLGSVLTSIARPDFTAGVETESPSPSVPLPQAQTRDERREQEIPFSEPLS